MRSVTVLEKRSHGDSLFPFASYRLKYPKDSEILDLHWHSELEFLIVTDGSGVFRLDNKEFILNKGEGLIIPGGTLHSGSTLTGSSCSFTAVVFNPDIITGTEDDRVTLKYIKPVLNDLIYMDPYIKSVSDKYIISTLEYISQLDKKREECYELHIKERLLGLFSALYQKMQNDSFNQGSSGQGIKQKI